MAEWWDSFVSSGGIWFWGFILLGIAAACERDEFENRGWPKKPDEYWKPPKR